jgi:hypothetical protein
MQKGKRGRGMRNKLIELLRQIEFDYGAECAAAFEDGYKGVDFGEFFADFLLAAGVIVLPCKMGSDVYDITEFIDKLPHPDMYEFSTDEIILSRCRKTKELIFGIDGIDYTFDEFGTRVFTSEDDAWKAIAERSENEHRTDN